MNSSTSLYLLLFLLIGSIAKVSAQDFPEWGKITAAEQAMTQYEQDTAANAVVLLDYGKIDLKEKSGKTTLTYNNYNRIKILKKGGFEVGDIRIPFMPKNNFEQLVICKAQITSPSGETVVLVEEDFFTEKTSETIHIRKFSFPNVEVGSILEYAYTLKTKTSALKDWYFQGNLPIKKSKLILTLAPYFKYDFHTQGPAVDSATVNGNAFSTDRDSPNYSHGYAGMVNKYVFVRNDIPALKDLPFINSMQDHYERIKFRLSQAVFNNKVGRLSHGNWSPAVKSMTNHNKFGWQYKTKGYFREIANAVKPLIKKTKDKETQLNIIYDYLVSRMNIVEKQGVLVEKSLNYCFKERQASAVEMNLMLVALAKNFKIGDACPMAISTRTNGKVIEDYPFLDQFDHVLAHIKIGDKTLILDAANAYLPMGYPAVSSLNEKGLLMQPLVRWAEITPPKSAQTFQGNFSLKETGMLTGETTMTFAGYEGSKARAALAKDATGKELYKELIDRYPDFNLLSTKPTNLKDINAPLQVNVAFEVANIGQNSQDYLYFNPLLYPSIEENPFKQPVRKQEINLPYPTKEVQKIRISIPDAFEIVDVPEDATFSFPGIGNFTYTISVEKQTIVVHYTYEMTQATIAAKHYKELQELFSNLVHQTGGMVTLKRKKV